MGARGTAVLAAAQKLDEVSRIGSQTAPTVRLLVVDHAPTRAGIRMALDGAALICAECSEVDRAIRAAKSQQPDIALIGREITGDWRAAVRGVCRAAPQCRVVVLAQTSDIDDMLESVRAGALGYVPGALTAESLRAIFRFAHANEALIPRTMVAELLTLDGIHRRVSPDRSGHGQTAHLRARAQARPRESRRPGAAGRWLIACREFGAP